MKGEFSIQKANKNDNKCWVVYADGGIQEAVVVQSGINLDYNHSIVVLATDEDTNKQTVRQYDDRGRDNSGGGTYLENIPVLVTDFKISYITLEDKLESIVFDTYEEYDNHLFNLRGQLLKREVLGLTATAQEIWE